MFKFAQHKTMEDNYKLTRFLEAQNQVYLNALSEISAGRKQSHWMWFVFPQLKGLGKSISADYYGITGQAEALAYLHHPVLGKHLAEISGVLLMLKGKTAREVFGSPDDLKLRSCMTLFMAVAGEESVFKGVLDSYFDGSPDPETIRLLSYP